MGFDNNDDDSIGNQIKKHLDDAEKRLNSRFNHLIEQMSGQSTENNVIQENLAGQGMLIRFGIADRMMLARDIAILSNELEVLEIFLASKFPELKVLTDHLTIKRKQREESNAKDY